MDNKVKELLAEIKDAAGQGTKSNWGNDKDWQECMLWILQQAEKLEKEIEGGNND